MKLEQLVKTRSNRRRFLECSAAGAATVAARLVGAAESDNASLVRVAIVGCRAQGKRIAEEIARFDDTAITALCDVDGRLLPMLAAQLTEKTGITPACESDFRRVMNPSKVDAVVIATPDHWHAEMVTTAAEAGLHVYCEAPLTRTHEELQQVGEAVEKSGIVLQGALPHRSGPHFQSAIDAVHTGRIGQVRLARAWSVSKRTKPVAPAPTTAPEEVDYESWLGTAEPRGFCRSRFHHTWKNWWDYGCGELGLLGTPLLDIACWGLDVSQCNQVAATGSVTQAHRETPDTLVAQLCFGDSTLLWEHRCNSERGLEGRSAAVAFYGDEGTLIVDNSGWTIYGGRNAETVNREPALAPHLRDFIDSIRNRRHSTAAPFPVAANSTALVQRIADACRQS